MIIYYTIYYPLYSFMRTNKTKVNYIFNFLYISFYGKRKKEMEGSRF